MAETIIERKIGDITMDATISEKHEDSLTVTEHPIEKGAAISDHAYKNPMWVTIIAGKGMKDGESVPRETYEALLELQQSREPFNIITGKREYENMLAQTINVMTDTDTENVLMVMLDCCEVIITETEVTQVPASRQRQAAKTQSATNTGTKQAQNESGKTDEEQVRKKSAARDMGFGGETGYWRASS